MYKIMKIVTKIYNSPLKMAETVLFHQLINYSLNSHCTLIFSGYETASENDPYACVDCIMFWGAVSTTKQVG